ncbi:craniofacial development protein 2-like [Mytilus edulis]|uniref:craniofacial development protein 2-like n=1 Tax=Mytilus edulis TaxID=6550 RepID=UPI0039EEDE15
MELFSNKLTPRIGTWNVRTLYQSGKCAQVTKEMDRYKIEILGLSEVRWNTSGMTNLNTGHTIIYSGNTKQNDPHEKGVGFLITKRSKTALLEWNPISPRIITARFNSRFQKKTLIQVYAPTNGADDCEKEDFYHSLQTTIEKVPKRDLLVLMGDLNAKVGSERKGWDREIDPHGIGKMNENGELFADFCTTNNLVIGGTLFKHKNCHKVTWVSPAGNAENQIDHITISQRWRSSLQDVRVKWGADAASDHHLVIGSIKMKLLAQKKSVVKRRKFNVGKLKIPNIREEFQISLQNRFSAISDLDIEENDINNTWEQTKNVILETCEETLGYMQYKR